ncbi:unnamed protein product [Lactuca saligna]|uniref:Arabidopsis retrotransposon Orf1 C-terminal domain-containing protein n=2 Tax=Lactuca saligna TaxID=75948 RepID=A0AA35Z6U3_LACSI|nr:unnamed protein product [Lactuca saligna]
MGKTTARTRTHGSSIDPNPQKDVAGPSRKAAGKRKKRGEEGSDPSLTNAEIKTYRSNLRGRAIRPTKFYHKKSMKKLGVHDGVYHLFIKLGWRGFLRLCDRTYEEPTMEFLSTYARDDDTKVLTFQLKGEHHRLTYEELDSIMGIDDPFRISPQNQEYQDFLRYPDANFWMQISGLATFNPSRQRAKHIVHPCWRIAHRVLTTSIFGRLEPGQINRCELFFLRSMRRALPLSFSGFFLDKCDSIRQRSSGEIFIGGLITIIGRAVGLDFPDPEYIPVDTPPNFLLDCDTLIRMEMLLDRGTRTYSWLDSDKAPVYILPSWIGSSFDTGDPDTWLPPDQLTQAGVFPEFGDDEGDDAEQQEEEDDEENDEMPEAEDHFDQPSMQQPMFPHDQFQAPPHHFDQPHQQEGHEVPPYFPPTFFDQFATMFSTVQRIDAQTQENSRAILDVASRVDRLEQSSSHTSRQVQDMWDYHYRHGHFPPPDRPI